MKKYIDYRRTLAEHVRVGLGMEETVERWRHWLRYIDKAIAATDPSPVPDAKSGGSSKQQGEVEFTWSLRIKRESYYEQWDRIPGPTFNDAIVRRMVLQHMRTVAVDTIKGLVHQHAEHMRATPTPPPYE